MDDLLTATSIGSGATAALHVLGYLLTGWRENQQMQATLHARIMKTNIDAMERVIRQEAQHPWLMVTRSLGRFLLLGVALTVLAILTLYGLQYPETIINVPQQDPYILKFFGMTVAELNLGTEWKQFTGAVALPIWFMIIGAGITHYFLADILRK